MRQTALVVGKRPGPIASVLDCLGFEVEHLVEPAEALGEIVQRHFRLIAFSSPSYSEELLDFCIALRRIDREVPLVVTAQRTAIKDRAWTLELGADEFLDPMTSHDQQKTLLTAVLRRAGSLRVFLPSLVA